MLIVCKYCEKRLNEGDNISMFLKRHNYYQRRLSGLLFIPSDKTNIIGTNNTPHIVWIVSHGWAIFEPTLENLLSTINITMLSETMPLVIEASVSESI